MNRAIVLILALIPALGSSECTPPVGPAKYGNDQLLDLTIEPGRLCSDPAGAPIVVRGTYTFECVEPDSCGRELGDVYEVPMVLDGRAEIVEGTLDNGDPYAVWANCAVLTEEFSGVHPVDGPGRDLGGLADDCTIGFDAPGSEGTQDWTLAVTMNNFDVSATASCPGEPPYGPMTPTTLAVETVDCTDGATLTVQGEGTARCQDGSKCTPGEDLTFSYTLGPQGTWPETELSNGETLHLPFSCVNPNVNVRGLLDGARKSLGRMDENCVLTVNADKVARATDVRLEGNYGWAQDVAFDLPCE